MPAQGRSGGGVGLCPSAAMPRTHSRDCRDSIPTAPCPQSSPPASRTPGTPPRPPDCPLAPDGGSPGWCGRRAGPYRPPPRPHPLSGPPVPASSCWPSSGSLHVWCAAGRGRGSAVCRGPPARGSRGCIDGWPPHSRSLRYRALIGWHTCLPGRPRPGRHTHRERDGSGPPPLAPGGGALRGRTVPACSGPSHAQTGWHMWWWWVWHWSPR